MGPTGPVLFTFYHVACDLPARALRSQHRPNMSGVMGSSVAVYKSFLFNRLDPYRHHVAPKLIVLTHDLAGLTMYLLQHHNVEAR